MNMSSYFKNSQIYHSHVLSLLLFDVWVCVVFQKFFSDLDKNNLLLLSLIFCCCLFCLSHLDLQRPRFEFCIEWGRNHILLFSLWTFHCPSTCGTNVVLFPLLFSTTCAINQCPYICVSISGLSILFHSSVYKLQSRGY